MALDIILLGPPGSGKGTQGERLAEWLAITRISTGDLLREAVAAGTELGRKAEPIMKSGGLVPDEIVLGMVRERAATPQCAPGMLLDGFPRTIPQADGLEQILAELGRSASAVIDIEVADEEIISRLTGRLSCPGCKAIYHKVARPPVSAGVCDECGAALVHRADDTEAAVRERLDVYHAQTEPLERYYEEKGVLRRVDGMGSIEEVAGRIEAAMAQG